MEAGVQCFDPIGSVIFDQTTNVVKFVGIASVGMSHTGEAASGAIYVPEFTQLVQHEPFFARIDGGFHDRGYDAVFWVNPGEQYLRWEFPRPNVVYFGGFMYNRPNQTVVYGVL